jgi:hypothetical protein
MTAQTSPREPRRIKGFAQYEEPYDDCDWASYPVAQSGQDLNRWNGWDWFQMAVMVLFFGLSTAFGLWCLLSCSLS